LIEANPERREAAADRRVAEVNWGQFFVLCRKRAAKTAAKRQQASETRRDFMGGRACNDEFRIQPAGRMIAFPLILPAAPFAIGEVERLAVKLAATDALRRSDACRKSIVRRLGAVVPAVESMVRGRVDRRENFSRRSQKEKR